MDNLAIHENKLLGVHVKDLLEIFVGSVDEVYQVMRRGQSSRSVGSTNMNLQSSRSHAIFQLTIIQKNLLDGSIKTSKLSLVDLAGSEKIGKSGATGQTLEEAKKINKSLSTLGMVINALTDGKSTHVPYRDSKLTRILQESLGGNARTTLIINCSLCPSNEAETLGTLRFGMRAKNIKNKPRINSELSANELKELLKKAKDKINLLESDLTNLGKELVVWRSGTVVPENEWFRLDSRCSSPIKSLEFHESLRPSIDTHLSESEREGFLARETELADQLAEREKESKTHADVLAKISQELLTAKSREIELAVENQNIYSTLTETKLSLEKLVYENKEMLITLETLQESYAEKDIELKALRVSPIKIGACS
jgi:kinesin family protein 5